MAHASTSMSLPSRSEIAPPLSIKEAAEYTGTSESSVRRWIARGELRAFKYGHRAIRIEIADLRKMRREVNPATYSAMHGGDAS